MRSKHHRKTSQYTDRKTCKLGSFPWLTHKIRSNLSRLRSWKIAARRFYASHSLDTHSWLHSCCTKVSNYSCYLGEKCSLGSQFLRKGHMKGYSSTHSSLDQHWSNKMNQWRSNHCQARRRMKNNSGLLGTKATWSSSWPLTCHRYTRCKYATNTHSHDNGRRRFEWKISKSFHSCLRLCFSKRQIASRCNCCCRYRRYHKTHHNWHYRVSLS